MAQIRAALLAAGRGVRMGGERPKTLLPLNDHDSMLTYILLGLKSAGVEDLLVITGFEAGQVEAAVEERWSGTATFVRNSRYASWGNFHSARLAVDQSPAHDLMIVNCDIVVPPAVYERVMATDGDLVLAVQRRERLNEEDMRVQLDGGAVRRVSKDLHMARSHGEYCGVSLLRERAQRAYGDVANGLEWSAKTSLYYEDVYDRIMTRIDARAAEVRAGEYAEVDTPEDVADASSVIERHFKELAAPGTH